MSVCLCCVASHHFWVMYVLGKVCFLYEETRKAMVSVVDTKKPSLLLLLLRLLRTTSLPPPSPPSLPGEWAPVAHDIWPGATGWTSSVPLSSSAVTTCGIYGTMVGGFGVFGAGDHIEKTFTGHPKLQKLIVNTWIGLMARRNGHSRSIFLSTSRAEAASKFYTNESGFDCHVSSFGFLDDGRDRRGHGHLSRRRIRSSGSA